MHIVKLNAIPSTNTFLKEQALKKELDDFTVIVAQNQEQGRGQMGAVWQSEPGKNLTFSIFKRVEGLEATKGFNLNILVSLGIYRALQTLQIPDLHIKWPNDILSGNHKICGILIENILKGKHINGSVIGIGLNVNQTTFTNLPKVSSLKNLTGKVHDLDEVLVLLLEKLKEVFNLCSPDTFWKYAHEYNSLLFKKDKPVMFKDTNEVMFPGIIRGVTEQGLLKVELEDEIIKTFELKQIKMLY